MQVARLLPQLWYHFALVKHCVVMDVELLNPVLDCNEYLGENKMEVLLVEAGLALFGDWAIRAFEQVANLILVNAEEVED